MGSAFKKTSMIAPISRAITTAPTGRRTFMAMLVQSMDGRLEECSLPAVGLSCITSSPLLQDSAGLFLSDAHLRVQRSGVPRVRSKRFPTGILRGQVQAGCSHG